MKLKSLNPFDCLKILRPEDLYVTGHKTEENEYCHEIMTMSTYTMPWTKDAENITAEFFPINKESRVGYWPLQIDIINGEVVIREENFVRNEIGGSLLSVDKLPEYLKQKLGVKLSEGKKISMADIDKLYNQINLSKPPKDIQTIER